MLKDELSIQDKNEIYEEILHTYTAYYVKTFFACNISSKLF